METTAAAAELGSSFLILTETKSDEKSESVSESEGA